MHTKLPPLPLIDPQSELKRSEQPPVDLRDFLERTRRYHKLTRQGSPLRYARGLDSKPEDMA